MQRTSNETTPALEHLTEEVRDLERRVRALEARSAGTLHFANGPPAELQIPGPAPAPRPAFTLPPFLFVGVIPVLGISVLGIAGAYLLRAAAESGALPGPAAVAMSAVYAALWLVKSVKARPGRELVRVIYAATAALIFFPMLWETTVRFKVLPSVASAGLLIAFVLLGSALTWRHGPALVMWVTALPAAATAVILIVATGELTFFVIALLAICAVVESAGVRDLQARIRPWVAVLSDIGVALMIYLAALPQQTGAYRPVGRPIAAGVCFVLLGIYASSVGFRTAGLRRGITLFEAAQMAVAWTLAVGGALRLTHNAAALGAFCLLSAGVLYWSAFTRFNPATSGRNHRVYASLGLGLFLTASVLLVSGSVAAMLWSGCAVAAMFVSTHAAHPTPALHGAAYLTAAAFLSGLLDYGRLAMTGAVPPALPSAILWIAAAATVLSYFACPSGPEGKWPRLLAATLGALAAAAFLVTIVARSAGGAPSASWLPTIRTLVICAVALSAGVAGRRLPLKPAAAAAPLQRIELVWICYAAMALVTMKLFVEDFRESSLAALAVSLLGYGAVLIFGPRLMRSGTPRSPR
jgi:hypothetical protein